MYIGSGHFFKDTTIQRTYYYLEITMKFTIKSKLLASFAATIIIPMLIIGIMIASKVKSKAIEDFSRTTTDILVQVDNGINLFFNEVKSSVEMLTRTELVKSIDNNISEFTDTSQPTRYVLSEKAQYEQHIWNFMAQVGASNSNFVEVYMGTKYGSFLSDTQPVIKAGMDPRTKGWYKIALEHPGKSLITAAYMSNTGFPVIGFVASFDATERQMGVIGIDASLSKLSEIINTMKIGETGYVIMVQDDGIVLANPHNKEMNFKHLSKFSDFAHLAELDAGLSELTHEGVDYQAMIYNSPELGWKFIGIIETSEIMATVDAITFTIIILSVVLLLAFLVFAYFMANSITLIVRKIMDEMAEITSAVAAGKLDARIDSHDINFEFRGISDGTNEMIEAFVKPINIMAEYVDRISKGDIPAKITEEYQGDFNELKNNLNGLIDITQGLLTETNQLIDDAIHGKLDTRCNSTKFVGEWSNLVGGINSLVDAFAHPLNMMIDNFDRISKGDIPDKMSGDYQGSFDTMQQSLNSMIDIISIIIEGIGRLTNSIKEGDLTDRGNVDLFTGDWKTLVEGINGIVENLVDPLQILSSSIVKIGKGEIPEPMDEDYQGDLLEMQNGVNAALEGVSGLKVAKKVLEMMALNDFSETFDGTYLGIFADVQQAVNEVRERLVHIQDTAVNISRGDLKDLTEFKNIGKRSKKDRLNPSLIAMMEAISALVKDANLLAEAGAGGKLDTRADAAKHEGEYQNVITGLNNIMDNLIRPLKQSAKFIENTARGIANEKIVEEAKGDYNEIKENMNTLTAKLTIILTEITGLSTAAADGNLKQRINNSALEGNWVDLTDGINATVENILKPVNEAVSVIKKMSVGDLTDNMTGDYKGDHAILKDSLNTTLESLNNLLLQVNMSVEQVNSGAAQVSDASQSLSQGSTEQAASLEQISSSMQEIGSQSKHNADNAAVASKLSITARDNAEGGNKQMDQLNSAMADINSSSAEIKKVIKVIDGIAFQTNLLAINAAVEAARAGVHGKGFAVVASEVRILAQRSATAAKETTELIEGSVKQAERGSKMTAETVESLKHIVEGIVKVSDIVEEISAASDEQAKGVGQTNDGLDQVSQVTQQNAANSEETAAASVELSSQADALRGMIAKFRLKDHNPAMFNNSALSTIPMKHNNRRVLKSRHNEQGWGGESTKVLTENKSEGINDDDFGDF